MKKLIFIIISASFYLSLYSQGVNVYQKGVLAENDLRTIGALTPYASGGFGFDTRYEGVKGSPRLLDTLLPSFLLLKGQDKYLELRSDIDFVRHMVLFKHPVSGKLFVIPVGEVMELIIKGQQKDMVFRTTSGRTFEKPAREERFIEVLYEGPVQLIRMPGRVFIQADFKNAYSADRRYDEFRYNDKYYLTGPDNVFHQIQLTRKSVLKLYPGLKKSMDQEPDESSFSTNEEMILSLLRKL